MLKISHILGLIAGLLIAQGAQAQFLVETSSGTDVIEFGVVPVGSSAQGFLRITNIGTTTLENVSVSVRGDDYTVSPCFTPMFPGDSCGVRVNFQPTRKGAFIKRLDINSDTFEESVRLEGWSEPLTTDPNG